MLRILLKNHVFANLAFFLILVTGFIAYHLLPRQQDPEMNFNWINILTLYPGASAEDVEKLVTDPLEEALEKVADIRFVASSSRESNSNILVRFRDVEERVYDKRVADLRREIQNKQRELPTEVEDPVILEITSSNGFPAAMLAVVGQEDDENLRRRARQVRKEVERLSGVDKANPLGLNDAEIQVRFRPEAVAQAGLTPTALVEGIAARLRDLAGGQVDVEGVGWSLRYQGQSADPAEIALWPVVGAEGEIPLGRLAEVSRGRKKPDDRVLYQGRAAVLLAVTKREGANVLELTDRLRDFITERNRLADRTGVELVLVDDRSHFVREVLAVMESNALFGLVMVALVTWIFLGSRLSLLVSLGVPFSLAGTFLILHALGESLNVMVLLGVVITLGMLVDDAVVVVETIYVRLQSGLSALEAGVAALKEVAMPVTTSVLTTVAAFLPLMLLPGILGKFMKVIPMVVCLGLTISLLEAFWMLPAHVAAMKLDFSRPSRLHHSRQRMLRWLRGGYTRLLIAFLRRSRLFFAVVLGIFALAGGMMAKGLVPFEFFAFDPFPLFYVNVEMPADSTLARTLEVSRALERRLLERLQPGELQSSVVYAGQQFTETKPMFGDRYGQILISLTPKEGAHRPVRQIIDDMRPVARAVAGPVNLSFLPISGGPPVTKPISVKVRGVAFPEILAGVERLKEIIREIPGSSDIGTDYASGRNELVLRPDGDALQRAGLSPGSLTRLIRLLGDGEVATSLQHEGEKVEVRVQAAADWRDMAGLLATPVVVSRGEGGLTTLGSLARPGLERGMESIQHYDYRRTVTVEADLNQEQGYNTVKAYALIKKAWAETAAQYPGIDLDFSGILDDIEESLGEIAVLFLFGIGLIYMILGAQFNSYFQPLLILTTVPMAFTGVVFGLYLAGLPLSLYTLYGVVALSGVAVNSAIVLIDAANERRRIGLSATVAVVLAAKRRLVPILVTSLTTIAGLMSLATGLGGKSLMWGPVATAIVWGLTFSTVLTLFVIPLLYRVFMEPRSGRGR
ncbi:MAG: efflux RND transporter permease subunit [Magnetococcales bacterium]|nr:efflux RND transporter permease subunit [Magnetococcales bacterium]